MRFFFVFFGVWLSCVGANADTPAPRNLTYATQSLQKELYEIIVAQSEEYTKEDLDKGTLYQNEKSQQYQKIVNALCEKKNMTVCPTLYFTKEKIIGGKMEPNGFMLVSEASMSKLSLEETKFVLYHETGHLYLQHAKKRMEELAWIVQQGSYVVMDPERLLPAQGFLPGMKEFRQQLEEEADKFSYHELQSQHIAFDCLAYFHKLTGNQTVSQEQHKSVAQRCADLAQ